MITQALAWPGFRTIAILQSLTPYLALLMAPLAVVALATGETWIAAARRPAIGIGGLVLARPILFPCRISLPLPTMRSGCAIASVNLLYTNDESNIDEVAVRSGRPRRST